jgi:hypothetical protein
MSGFIIISFLVFIGIVLYASKGEIFVKDDK